MTNKYFGQLETTSPYWQHSFMICKRCGKKIVVTHPVGLLFLICTCGEIGNAGIKVTSQGFCHVS